jgi:hypothetical protein
VPTSRRAPESYLVSLARGLRAAAGDRCHLLEACTAQFWSLTRRGVSSGKTRVAMARELAGFVWALMTHQEHEIAATA